jgi:hypothetical protein
MNVKAVDFVKRPGALALVLTDAGRAAADEIRDVRTRHGIDAALHELCEFQLCNGWEVLHEQDLAALGALTGCNFIVSEDVERDDYGNLLRVGSVFWNPDYAVEDEIETLFSKGEMVFKEVKADAA